ncbi:MAG TPA: prepilin-type N-terminal cleavage/methylation domain-containing protein [Candidatus Pacearchaeota archaeon]|nr:prepilin-type N-terminal cleavage/methylation domain-containing protein [Candidatus Pacearchaeota archaeon]
MIKNKSFTLIELLVVIVIIGILAGVIMISTSSSIDKANFAKAQTFSNTVQEELLLNLVSEWTFDNLSQNAGVALPLDTIIEDEWGSFDGLSKGDAIVRGGVECIKGKCLDFSSDWIEIPNFNIGNSATVSFWAKSRSYNNSMSFSFNTDVNVYGPDLFFTGNNICWNTGDSSSNYFTNNGLPNSNWHHFVVANDEFNVAKLYIDGLTVGTAVYKSVKTTAKSFYIAKFNTGSPYYFTGLMDEFIIYDKPLSAKQVKRLYAYYNNFAFK